MDQHLLYFLVTEVSVVLIRDNAFSSEHFEVIWTRVTFFSILRFVKLHFLNLLDLLLLSLETCQLCFQSLDVLLDALECVHRDIYLFWGNL